jgi:hypothetical protein
MRRFILVLFICTFPILAQRGGHGGGGGGMRGGSGGMRGGSGGGMRGGSSGGFRGGGFSGGFHAGGGFRNGFRGGFNNQRFFRGNFGFRRFPRTFFYPAFYGDFGFYDPYFYNSYPNYGSYPSAGYSYNSDPTPVIISQNYYSGYPAETQPAPRVEEYRPPPQSATTEERKDESSLYLIAFKDHIIRAVIAYWADGAILHYVTMDHEQKQTTVTSVDRDLSERLNRERNVAFHLK